MKINMRRLSVILFLVIPIALCAGISRADIVANPDSNTLWREDGSSAPTGADSSADHWRNDGLDVKAAEGNLQFNAPDAVKVSTGRYVQAGATYPYMVFQIHDFKPLPGYHGFTIFLSNQSPSLSLVSQINPGIYTLDLRSFLPASPATSFMSLYLYNGQLTLSELSMVKLPDNFISTTSPKMKEKGFLGIGDDVTFTVTMKDAAEDVSLNFFDSYGMPQLKINGEQTLQLKPKDATQKVWSATIKLQTIEGLRSTEKGQLPAFHLMTKAVILGSTLKQPLWTAIPYPVHLNAPVATPK